MFIAIIYILLATAAAGCFYWERINMDDYNVDHEFDVFFSVLIGLFFPIAALPALLFCYLRKLKKKRDKK